MTSLTLEEGRRVRLLVDLADPAYRAGDTGYLHCWIEEPHHQPEPNNWGVVFDKDEDQGTHTVVWAFTSAGDSVHVVDVVELVQPPADEDAAAPICPVCGSETLPAVFGSALGFWQCTGCDDMFKVAS